MQDPMYGFVFVTVSGLDLLVINLKTRQPIEKVHKALAVGDDVFLDSPVDQSDVTVMAQTLNDFKKIMNDNAVSQSQIVGSEALSRAINADYISDQLFLRVGVKIRWLSLNEEAYFLNQAVLVELKAHPETPARFTDLRYFISFNSGSISISQFNGQTFNFATYLPLGPVKIAEELLLIRQTVPNTIEVLNDYIDSKLADFHNALPDNAIAGESEVVLMGTISLNHLKINQESGLTIEDFDTIFDDISEAPDQYIHEQYGIPENEITLLLPELLLSRRLLQLAHAKRVLLPHTNVLDGLAIDVAARLGFQHLNFTSQTIIAAKNMADHYKIEPMHQRLVTKFALHLFDQLRPLHQLGNHERLLLQVAAILHDAGAFIDAHDHFIHSDYLILHSDLIGLSNFDRDVIAAVTRFHSLPAPETQSGRFEEMPTEERLLVAKLAAILRVADSLDDDRQQKIGRISVSIKPKKIVVSAYSNQDLALEKWIFSAKSQFFEETFGVRIQLKQRQETAKLAK